MTSLAEVRNHPIFRALDPAGKDFMQIRRLSFHLNPLAVLGVQIAAAIPFGVFPHIKTIATVGMMLEDFEAGRYEGKHTLVVDSSGNTAHAAARLAPAFGFKNIKIVLSNDVPDSKRGILDALSSVETIALPFGVAARAREEGSRPGCYHLNQYGHMGNLRAHEKFTGPALMQALGEEPGYVFIAMGSGGTAAGVGRFFKQHYSNVVVIGVRPKLGEQVPGARDKQRMEEVVTLPWQEYVDNTVEASRKQSFIAMRQLWSEVEPQPGPSSGLARAGLGNYFKSWNPISLERELSGRNRLAVFICPDDGRFYSERTTGELDPDQGLL